MNIKEGDWKLFRELLPGWQEAYMERLIDGYSELLSGSQKASEKFWLLDERLRKDRQSLGVRVNNVTRSGLQPILTGLLIDRVITEEDLKDFSDEMRESIGKWSHIYHQNEEK